jgi:hypothetical protein
MYLQGLNNVLVHLKYAASPSVLLDQMVVGWEALHKENSNIRIVRK